MPTREEMPKSRGKLWKIAGLPADGPFLDMKDKLALFGQFVGDWDIEARYPQPDGTEVRRTGEVHFAWILEGRALQDVWSTHDKDTGRPVPAGTTIRFYDSKIDAWRVIWISPIQNIVQISLARKVKDQIVLKGRSKEDNPERWIFSEIKPDSFRWHSEETRDNGKTWILTEDMRIRRHHKQTQERS